MMSYSEEDIQAVWEKGRIVSNNDPNVWRKDECNAWIKRTEYGNRDSQYGWEIDHIDPKGSDDIENLRPLQWENNVATSDSGKLTCVVTTSGTKNTKK